MGLAVEELLEVVAAREARISADGRTVAFRLTSIDRAGDRERREIQVVDASRDGGEVVHRGTAGWSPAFSPDARALAHLAAGAEEGVTDLRLLSLADGSSRTLHSFAGRVADPTFAPDGRRLAVAVEAEGAPSAIVIVTLGGGIETVPGDGAGADAAPSWSPDGERLAFARSWPGGDGTGPTGAIAIWEGPTGAVRLLQTGLAYVTCPSWSPDGARLAAVGTVRPRLGGVDPGLRLWLLDRDGDRAMPLAPELEGIVLEPAPRGPVWAADAGAVYCRAARRGAIELVHVAVPGGAVEAVSAGRQVVDFSLAADGTIAQTVISPTDPGCVEVLAGGVGRRLDASVGGWTRERATLVPVPAGRRFGGGGGRELDGWVAGVDESRSPQPTLVGFHGGPHGYFGPGFQGGHFYRDVLASRGWIVLTLNSTGSGSYGAEFADGLRGGWGEIDLPEHLAALEELIAEGLADPDRLAVAGYSYGGYLAAWAVTQDSRFQAAVVGAPIADLLSFERTSDIGSWYTPWQMNGGLPENLERYRRLSPVTHAAAVTTPTLLLHGQADRRCPPGQSEELRDRLAAAGNAEVELVRYEDADHLFYSSGRPSQRLDFNRRIVEWLETHVTRGGADG